MSCCPLGSLSHGLLTQVKTIVKVGLLGRPLYPKTAETISSSVSCLILTLYSLSQNLLFDAFPRCLLGGFEIPFNCSDCFPRPTIFRLTDPLRFVPNATLDVAWRVFFLG